MITKDRLHRAALRAGNFVAIFLFLLIIGAVVAVVYSGAKERQRQHTEQQQYKGNADDWVKEYGGEGEIRLEDAR